MLIYHRVILGFLGIPRLCLKHTNGPVGRSCSMVETTSHWIKEMLLYIIEGSLEVKLPTIWRDEKQSRAEAERRGRLEERRSEEKE